MKVHTNTETCDISRLEESKCMWTRGKDGNSWVFLKDARQEAGKVGGLKGENKLRLFIELSILRYFPFHVTFIIYMHNPNYWSYIIIYNR